MRRLRHREVTLNVHLHDVERSIHVVDAVLDLLRSALCREVEVCLEGVRVCESEWITDGKRLRGYNRIRERRAARKEVLGASSELPSICRVVHPSRKPPGLQQALHMPSSSDQHQ